MLPDPSLSLTIPSVQDHTVLDCRVYHPYSLSSNPKAPTWQRHAAILAHPYAPLGGCYDDPIVAEAAAQLLRSGYLVATFNFRGAAGSAGRTSWTAKPEGDDYMSVIGFIVYYIHYLDPFRPTMTTLDGSLDPGAVPASRPQQPSLLIGGYSYGSIITMQMPALEVVLERFASPAAGSAAAQIRLRAEHLATQYNEVLRSAREARAEKRGRTYARTSLRVGGDEEPGSPRRSGESERRSFSMDAEEKVRKSLHELFHRHKERGPELGHPTHTAHVHSATEGERLQALSDLIVPRPSYLLISPVQGIARHLAMMNMWPANSSHSHEINSGSGETKLVMNPTLAVYGDRDGFVAAAKLRTWARKLSTQEGSHFRAIEVRSAGHFWHEEGVLLQLQTAVEDFAKSVLDESWTAGT